MENFLLWIIVIQGFFVMYFEYDVWRMNKHRFNERAVWREQKRKQAIKKAESISAPVSSEPKETPVI